MEPIVRTRDGAEPTVDGPRLTTPGCRPEERPIGRSGGPPLVSVILPTYNEAENITIQLDRLAQALDGIDHELIVVDDDSPDQTWRVAQNWSLGHPAANVIRRTTDRGLSSAVVLGMSVAGGRVLVTMDADLQHDESIIPEMVQTILTGHADITIGSRLAEGGSYGGFPLRRRLVSWGGTTLASLCLPTPVDDPMSGFFAISRERFDTVSGRINPRGFKILLEFLARGPRPTVAEIGYRFRQRLHGSTKMSGSVIVAYLLALIDLTVGRFVSATFTAYAIVGATGVAVRSVSGWLLGSAGLGWASLAAIEISILWNFALNNAFTFSTVAHRGKARFRPLALFHLVSAQGLLVQTAVTALLADDPVPSEVMAWRWAVAGPLVIGIVAATVGNYYLNSTITWPTSRSFGRRHRDLVQRQTLSGAGR